MALDGKLRATNGRLRRTSTGRLAGDCAATTPSYPSACLPAVGTPERTALVAAGYPVAGPFYNWLPRAYQLTITATLNWKYDCLPGGNPDGSFTPSLAVAGSYDSSTGIGTWAVGYSLDHRQTLTQVFRLTANGRSSFDSLTSIGYLNYDSDGNAVLPRQSLPAERVNVFTGTAAEAAQIVAQGRQCQYPTIDYTWAIEFDGYMRLQCLDGGFGGVTLATGELVRSGIVASAYASALVRRINPVFATSNAGPSAAAFSGWRMADITAPLTGNGGSGSFQSDQIQITAAFARTS